MKIVTDYWAKPIPFRQFDWSAWEDGNEEGPVGYGSTEENAREDFKLQISAKNDE